jgi:DNA-binding response OmpR family regulator
MTSVARKGISGEAPHLLLVGHRLDLRDVLASYFRSEGFSVSVAAVADDAEAILAQGKIDGVVIDCPLQDTGAAGEIAAAAREMGAAAVLVSSDPAELAALRRSPYAVLAKPFHLRALSELIEATLRKPGQEASNQGS